MFSFTWLVNVFCNFQLEIFSISAIFMDFFQKIIEKEKKIQQDTAYLNEKIGLYSMNKN